MNPEGYLVLSAILFAIGIAGFLLRPGQQRLTDVQAASLRQHHQFLHFPDPGVEIKRELQL